ncbi:interleukin-17 receptor C [Mantella aurantiaca]
MTRVTFFSLLLVLSSLYGLSAQDRRALRTLPTNASHISCTGDLVCEQSAMFCIPGDIQTAVSPVLVPSDLKAETVKKCHNDGCSLCVQVTVEISAAFLTERSEELGSGDCDYEDSDYDLESYYGQESDEEEEESAEKAAVNVYLQLNNSNNGSLLCANLVIAPPSFSCYTMRVSLPLSSVPKDSSSRTVVGSLVYNCISVQPGTDMNITSYSYPRYSTILNINHEVPGCTKLNPLDNISKCESPVLDFVNQSNETSVGIVHGTKRQNVTVRVFYFSTNNSSYSNGTLIGEKRHYIAPSDIAPCMCIQAWYSNILDAVRSMICPFRNYSEEVMLNKSKLKINHKLDSYASYVFNASCTVEAEASLCWKSGSPPVCREIPDTRQKIISQNRNVIQGLLLLHPSLCVQVSIKGRVLHTECLNANVRREFHNEALLVLKNPFRNFSLCLVEDGGCKTLYSTAYQPRMNAPFLEQMFVKDVISGECVKVINSSEQHLYACPVDKYMRSRWTWSRMLCLLVVACFLLIVLLKIDDLKNWLKSMTTEKPLDEIFKDRRVLIFYSPDNAAYEELVRIFALSLKELKLDVVLDQWHRTEMAQVNPLPWYQRQKSEAIEKQGLIILLFSEGAQERYTAWKEKKAELIMNSDPYGSFGAVLNCVYPDFQKGQAKGRYLVTSFSSTKDVVPDLFSLLHIYMLPSNLLKLLQKLAGDNAKLLGRNQAKRLAKKISDRLQEPLKVCQKILNRQTIISQDGSEFSESPLLGEKVVVELAPLV